MTCRCPFFGIESGVPAIGAGVLLIFFTLVPYLVPEIPPLPLPASALFLGFGTFLIWAGLTKKPP